MKAPCSLNRTLDSARLIIVSAAVIWSSACAISPSAPSDQSEAVTFEFQWLNTPTSKAVAALPTPTTVLQATSTAVDTPTVQPTNTPEPTDVPTATPVPTDTPTEIPTATSLPTDTPTDLPTPTPQPTDTPTDLPTATNTATDVPTATPAPTETATEVPTATPAPTETATEVPTVTSTNVSEPTTTPVPSDSSETDSIEVASRQRLTVRDLLQTATTEAGSGGVRRVGELIDQSRSESQEEVSDSRSFVSIVTDGRNLNVRRGPGVEFGILTSVAPGEVVEVVETSDDGSWFRINLERFGAVGWVGAQFTQSADTPESALPPPDADLDTSVSEASDSESAEPEESAPDISSSQIFTVATAITQPENMNVRSGPGTVYAVLTVAPAGSQFEILGINPEGDWYQIRIPDLDEPGWIFVGLTDTAGPVEEIPTLSEDEIPEPPEQPVAVAGPAPALPPSGGGTFGYGVQAHMLGGGIDAATSATQAMGFNWIKQQVEWRIFEGSPGAIDFSELRRIVDSAGSRGIKVLFSVVNAPDWAREPGFDPSVGGPPADPQTYANFVGRLSGEFCGSPLAAIEVWNEQNLHYEWGNRPLNPAEYINLLRRAYGSIKAACPSMLVISGALTPTGPNGNLAVDDFVYLEGMYQNGLAAISDGIGAHPSGYNVPPSIRHESACTTIQQTGNFFNGACDNPHHSWSFRSTMEGYRNIMVVYGDANKRIWPTEFGWAAGGAFDPRYAYAEDNSFDEQALWTVEAFTMMRNWGWVGPAFLWNLNFRVVADGTEKAQWGIVRNDYSPLPIYYALQSMSK